MKIADITPDQILRSRLSTQEREQVVAELHASGVKPSDIRPDHLEAAGIDPARIPGLLFQVRCAELRAAELEDLRGVVDTLDVLAKQGRWGETKETATGDSRVSRTAARLAEILSTSETEGVIAAFAKADLDSLVAGLLKTRVPDEAMDGRLPDLQALHSPHIGEYSTSWMGQRVTIREGQQEADALTLYTFMGGAYVEAGAASGQLSPGGMVSFGYLSKSRVEDLLALIDRALASAPAPAPTPGRHPALSAAEGAATGRGFLLELKEQLLQRAKHLVTTETANAEAIRAADPKLIQAPTGAWVAAEQISIRAGYAADGLPFERDDRGYRLIIPEGAELWATNGRHPGELMREVAGEGLWIRHRGHNYSIEGDGYAASAVRVPEGLPAHWRVEEAPQQPAPRSYPRMKGHAIASAGLKSLHHPVARFALRDGDQVLTLSAKDPRGQPSPLGAIEVIGRPDGTLGLRGWRLEDHSVADLDHETLQKVETLATAAKAAAKQLGSAAGAQLADRLKREATAARVELERDPNTQQMRKLVEAGFDLSLPHLRGLVAAGIGPEALQTVIAKVNASIDPKDPEAFVTRAKELLWPEQVRLGRADVSKALDAGLRSGGVFEACEAAIGKILFGASEEERAMLREKLGAWSKSDWYPLWQRARIGLALLDGGATAKAQMAEGLQRSKSDYRMVLVNAWGLMAAAAESPEDRRAAFQAIEPHLDTNYFDMGGAVLSAAAVVASPLTRLDVARRAGANIDSEYWAFASGGLLASALCAGSEGGRREIFQRAEKELARGDSLRMCVCALNALALTAQSPEEKAKVLTLAHEYTHRDWKIPIRGAALLAMAMVSSDDPDRCRRASMANLDF